MGHETSQPDGWMQVVGQTRESARRRSVGCLCSNLSVLSCLSKSRGIRIRTTPFFRRHGGASPSGGADKTNRSNALRYIRCTSHSPGGHSSNNSTITLRFKYHVKVTKIDRQGKKNIYLFNFLRIDKCNNLPILQTYIHSEIWQPYTGAVNIRN